MSNEEKLKEENARLKASLQQWKGNHSIVIEDRDKLLSALVNLKAEVERLRKAGDAMADALNLDDDVFDNHEKKEAQAKWNAAKEGKPSV